MHRKLIAAIIFAGATIMVLSGARAATIGYDANAAQADAFAQHSAGHAFWLPGLLSGSSTFVFSAGPGDFVHTQGVGATLTGTIAWADDPTYQFLVDVTFAEVAPFPGYSGKRELIASAYSENGGPIDTSSWTFLDMTAGSLTGIDALAGALLSLSDRPELPGGVPDVNSMPFQLGLGANGKNIGFGFSGWLNYAIDSQADDTSIVLSGSYGDINIDLEPRTFIETPEPGTLALFGFGLLAVSMTTGRRLLARQR